MHLWCVMYLAKYFNPWEKKYWRSWQLWSGQCNVLLCLHFPSFTSTPASCFFLQSLQGLLLMPDSTIGPRRSIICVWLQCHKQQTWNASGVESWSHRTHHELRRLYYRQQSSRLNAMSWPCVAVAHLLYRRHLWCVKCGGSRCGPRTRWQQNETHSSTCCEFS